MLDEGAIRRLVHITRRTLSTVIRVQQPKIIHKWRTDLCLLQQQATAIDDVDAAAIFRGLIAVIDERPLPDYVSHPAMQELHHDLVTTPPEERPHFHTDLIEHAIQICTRQPQYCRAFVEELHRLLIRAVERDADEYQSVIFYLALLNVVQERPLILPSAHPLHGVFQEIRAEITAIRDTTTHQR